MFGVNTSYFVLLFTCKICFEHYRKYTKDKKMMDVCLFVLEIALELVEEVE